MKIFTIFLAIMLFVACEKDETVEKEMDVDNDVPKSDLIPDNDEFNENDSEEQDLSNPDEDEEADIDAPEKHLFNVTVKDGEIKVAQNGDDKIFFIACTNHIKLFKKNGEENKGMIDTDLPYRSPTSGFYLDGVFHQPKMDEGCDVIECVEFKGERIFKLVDYVEMGSKPYPDDFEKPEGVNLPDTIPEYKTVPLYGTIELRIEYSTDSECSDNESVIIKESHLLTIESPAKAPAKYAFKNLSCGNSYTGDDTEGFQIIETEDSLNSEMKKLFGQETPPKLEVDFSKESLALIRFGEKGSGGYGVKFTDFMEYGDFIAAEVLYSTPGNCDADSVMTYPYCIASFKRSVKPVYTIEHRLHAECDSEN